MNQLEPDLLFYPNVDLEVLYEEYQQHKFPELAINTQRNYRIFIEKFIEHQVSLKGGSTLISGSATFESARRDIKAFIREFRRVTPVQTNRTVGSLSSMFKWGAEEDLVRDNPVIMMPKAKETPKDRVVMDSELSSLFKTWDESQYDILTVSALKLILLTMLRSSEVLAIMPPGQRDSKREKQTLLDLERRQLTLLNTKNGHSHVVPLSDMAVQLLTAVVKHIGPAAHHPRPIFKTSMFGLRQVALRSAMRSGILKATPHDYRRTGATLCGTLGIPVDVIEGLLNHSPQGVTRRHYMLYAFDKERREALELVANHLKGLGLSV